MGIVKVDDLPKKVPQYGHKLRMGHLQASAVAVDAAFKGFAQGQLHKPKLWRQKTAADIRKQGATISAMRHKMRLIYTNDLRIDK